MNEQEKVQFKIIPRDDSDCIRVRDDDNNSIYVPVFMIMIFRAILNYAQSFCQKSAERKSPKK